jgi:trigger factor
MVTNQLHHLKDNFSQRLKAQGMSLEMLGMNEETFAKTYRDMAVQQVKGELLLDAIAAQEEITVDDSEIDAKMEEYAASSEIPLDQVKKYFENQAALAGLKGQILQEKVTKFLLDSAKITEVEPKKEDETNSDNEES